MLQNCETAQPQIDDRRLPLCSGEGSIGKAVGPAMLRERPPPAPCEVIGRHRRRRHKPYKEENITGERTMPAARFRDAEWPFVFACLSIRRRRPECQHQALRPYCPARMVRPIHHRTHRLRVIAGVHLAVDEELRATLGNGHGPANRPTERWHQRHCTRHETGGGRVISADAPRWGWWGYPEQPPRGTTSQRSTWISTLDMPDVKVM